MLEAVLDLVVAEEVRAERQPRAGLADVDVGPRRRLLKLQCTLAGDCLVKGHLVRRELDVAVIRCPPRGDRARLDARNGTRRNRRPRGRRDRADRQLVRFHVDRIGVRRERANLVVLVEGDAAARGSHRAVAVQAGGDHGEIVRLDLARRLSGVLQCVHSQDLARGKRHVAREVDVLRLQGRVLPERRACHVDRILRGRPALRIDVADAVMREVRAEHVRHLVVRQLQVARRAVADADGLRPAVGADAERARAGDGGARRTRDEVRYIVRVEVQRTARGDLHLARAARVLDRARRERDLVVRPRTIRADLEAARADDRLARLRRLDDDAVVRLKAVDRDGVAPLVAEDKLRELVAEELAVELLARDVESRARCIVVERQVALRLSRDDEATLADDVRRIVVRRRRDDLVRVHAKSADRVRAGVELRPCVKLHVVARNIDPDRRRAINNLYLGVLIQNDIAAARVERRLCVVALDL